MKGDDGRSYRIPLTHPSTIRNRSKKAEGVRKPLVDLGLPEGTQREVLEAIQRSFDDPSDGVGHSTSAGEDEEGEQGEEDEDNEGEEEEGIAEPGVEVKDPKEAFWDEFFDSLMLTVPFTFLYLLLDM